MIREIWGVDAELVELFWLFCPPPPVWLEPMAADVRPEPLAEPVVLVPPLPVEPSCSPTVRSTEAIVPSNPATSCVAARFAFALSSPFRAVVTLDRSAVSWVDDAPAAVSSASFACASASVDSTSATFCSSVGELMRREHVARLHGLAPGDVHRGHCAG